MLYLQSGGRQTIGSQTTPPLQLTLVAATYAQEPSSTSERARLNDATPSSRRRRCLAPPPEQRHYECAVTIAITHDEPRHFIIAHLTIKRIIIIICYAVVVVPGQVRGLQGKRNDVMSQKVMSSVAGSPTSTRAKYRARQGARQRRAQGPQSEVIDKKEKKQSW